MPENHFPLVKWTEIPKVFWSDLSNQPFEHCIHCEKYLLEEDTEYLIEKAIQSTEKEGVYSTIFEYAICFDCADQMKAQLSESSIQNINRFYAEHVDMDARREQLIAHTENTERDWLKNCIVKHKPYQAGSEYQIYGQCSGKRFLYFDMPFMISGEAMEEMIELISDETMDELDRFKDDLISGPPEFKEILDKGGPRVFI